METILNRIMQVIESRRQADVNESYVAKLLQHDENKLLKKIGEEATELVMAAKDADQDAIIYETADLLFHSMIVLARHNLTMDDVIQELARREGLSGLIEKAQRQSD